MLRSFIRRWLGLDSDLFQLQKRIDGYSDLYESSYNGLERVFSEVSARVKRIEEYITTPCPSPNLKPKTKAKTKVKK